MKARVKWVEGVTMLGESGSGHAVVMDGPPDHGGRNLGVRPMEMLLIGMGGCTQFDVLLILRKARQSVSDCVVELEAERANEDPKVFTRIHAHFRIGGKDLSEKAVERGYKQIGTLGSGNHYLEIQEVSEIFDAETATAFGLSRGRIVVSIHCGSRGLGHQIGTEFLKTMVTRAEGYGIRLPDRELACAPLDSKVGQAYLGAMRAGINCALANRQILTHLARRAFERVLPQAQLELLYDVSHNTCKQEYGCSLCFQHP